MKSEMSQYSSSNEQIISIKRRLHSHNKLSDSQSEAIEIAEFTEHEGNRRETEKEFSFFRKELVPSPLKADADFMMSANDNASHIRNTSESALSNNAPF
jgi:hypothetical protein